MEHIVQFAIGTDETAAQLLAEKLARTKAVKEAAVQIAKEV